MKQFKIALIIIGVVMLMIKAYYLGVENGIEKASKFYEAIEVSRREFAINAKFITEILESQKR